MRSFLANRTVSTQFLLFYAFLVTAEVKVVSTGCLNDWPVLVTYFTFLIVVGHFLPGWQLRLFLFDFLDIEASQIADYEYENGHNKSKSDYCEHWVKRDSYLWRYIRSFFRLRIEVWCCCLRILVEWSFYSGSMSESITFIRAALWHKNGSQDRHPKSHISTMYNF